MKDRSYKPGQLITINNQVFRIKRRNYIGFRTCDTCARVNGSHICQGKNKIGDFCTNLPCDLYLERVTPKHI